MLRTFMQVLNRSEEAVAARINAMVDEVVAFAQELIRIPTVNPPGDCYADCAQHIGARLIEFGYDVKFVAAEGMAEHTARHPCRREPRRPSP